MPSPPPRIVPEQIPVTTPSPVEVSSGLVETPSPAVVPAPQPVFYPPRATARSSTMSRSLLSVPAGWFRAFRAETSSQVQRFVKLVISVVSTCLGMAVVTWGATALLKRGDVNSFLLAIFKSAETVTAAASIIGAIVIWWILKASLTRPQWWGSLVHIGLSMIILNMFVPAFSPLIFLSVFEMYNAYILVVILLTAGYALLLVRPQILAQTGS